MVCADYMRLHTQIPMGYTDKQFDMRQLFTGIIQKLSKTSMYV